MMAIVITLCFQIHFFIEGPGKFEVSDAATLLAQASS
jgi:hypothetical protein